MSSSTAALLMYGAVIVAALALLGLEFYRRHRQQAVHRPAQLVRSQMHLMLARALREWIADERIVKALGDAGVASPAGLARLLENLDQMDERGVRDAVRWILQNNVVRRQVMLHMERQHGTDPAFDRHEAMQMLMLWAAEGRKAS